MNELQAFEKHLRENEKSPATIEKYLRDARAFLCWLDGRKPTKELTVCYKEGLTERYEAASVNSMLAGINSYLSFSGRAGCRVKPLRVQRTLFGSEDRELSREEYARLVRAAGGAQIGVVMQTICGTGIRVSELRHITAEAVRGGPRRRPQQGENPRDPHSRRAAKAPAGLYEKGRRHHRQRVPLEKQNAAGPQHGLAAP